MARPGTGYSLPADKPQHPRLVVMVSHRRRTRSPIPAAPRPTRGNGEQVGYPRPTGGIRRQPGREDPRKDASERGYRFATRDGRACAAEARSRVGAVAGGAGARVSARPGETVLWGAGVGFESGRELLAGFDGYCFICCVETEAGTCACTGIGTEEARGRRQDEAAVDYYCACAAEAECDVGGDGSNADAG